VKAGIGVGILLGFLALVALSYLLYRRYNQKAVATDISAEYWTKPELDDQATEARELTDDFAVVRELSRSPPAELEGPGHTRIDET